MYTLSGNLGAIVEGKANEDHMKLPFLLLATTFPPITLVRRPQKQGLYIKHGLQWETPVFRRSDDE